MSIRHGLIALSVLVATTLTACNAGGTSPPPSPSLPANTSAQTASRTYVLSSTAASYGLPPIGGFSGSLALPAAPVPANVSLQLTSSLQAPASNPLDARRHVKSTGTLNVYFYTTIRVSSTVTFSTLPGFSIDLPSTVDTTLLQFYYAISDPTVSDPKLQFRTEGPATVTGHTLTFAPSTTPLTLRAGLPYIVAFYATGSPLANQKVYVTNSFPDTSVLEFNAASNGNVPPVARIAGPNTGLVRPSGIGVDSAGRIYVATPSSILIFAADADGDVAPIATISGSNTGIQQLSALALDVAGRVYVIDSGQTILVFEAGATGNVAPVATITPTPTHFLLAIAVDSVGRIYVAGNDPIRGEPTEDIDIFPAGANGAVAPIATIVTASIFSLTVDATGKVYVSHVGRFSPGSVDVLANASANFTLLGTISGPDSQLGATAGVAVDAAGQIYVATQPSVNVFAAGTVSGVAPTAIIRGTKTGLTLPLFITVH